MKYVGDLIRGIGWRISCGDEFGEIVIVPGRGFQAQAEGIGSGGLASDVGGHVFEGDEVFWGMVGSNAALVVAEGHVHDPVQAVFCKIACNNDPLRGGFRVQ